MRISVGIDSQVHYDRKLIATHRGGPLQSSASVLGTERPERKPFHILSTRFLEGNDVLVQLSDGTAAIFEIDELEKLRPKPKQILATTPIHATEPAILDLVSSTPDPLVLDSAVA